jgi:hypothetical protein
MQELALAGCDRAGQRQTFCFTAHSPAEWVYIKFTNGLRMLTSSFAATQQPKSDASAKEILGHDFSMIYARI